MGEVTAEIGERFPFGAAGAFAQIGRAQEVEDLTTSRLVLLNESDALNIEGSSVGLGEGVA